MSEGYTYTTLNCGPGKPMSVRVSFYLDDKAWIRAVGTDNGQPLLTISHGQVSVNVGPAAPGLVTAEDARIARSLAEKATEYAAEIERLSTIGHVGPAGADAA